MADALNPICISGVVDRGHGVASGKARNNPFASGTIKLQTPFFKKEGIPMERYFSATINVDISPHQFDLAAWDYEVRQANWTDVIPPEDFYFSHCQLIHEGKSYDGLIYRPSPETKVDHFQKKSIVEILAPKIESLDYGDTVVLQLNSTHCKIT